MREPDSAVEVIKKRRSLREVEMGERYYNAA
jgi:hypothetical protein